ncbi:hypothetical protein HAX54_022738 [Datura stramonium]|uniref:Uncharacterized protein n=1 Tax=Datura stramonium TaxID=4076 RepID=A0ABS8UXA4_DATST|nr:hypothetical protein [Datura stramonium]
MRGVEKAKQKHRKGLWSPDEDQKLKDYILKHGHGCWSSVPSMLVSLLALSSSLAKWLQRTGKSCRLRWINYLRPGLKRGAFSIQEEDTIMTLHAIIGNKYTFLFSVWNDIREIDAQPAMSDNGAGSSESIGTIAVKRVARKTENIDSVSSPCSGYSSLEGSLSLADSDRFDFQKGPRKSNLPKVLFAEWFSLDQFSDQNSDLPKNNFGYNNSEFQDAFMHDLYMSEGVDNETVYDDMFQAQPKSEDQMYANGLDELLCSEFSINSDVINVHISHYIMSFRDVNITYC